MQNQTLKNIEIIAINDHSSDKSLNILIELAKNDKRIRIVNNDKNRGLLYSRAMGILSSSGEYLWNIDPDDELESNNALKFLYKKAKITKADIISFNIRRKDFNQIVKCKYINEVIKQPKLFNSIFNNDNKMIDFFIWNKLIKKELFMKAYKFFEKYIYMWKWNFHEDLVWSILVNKFAKSKMCLDKLVYIYNNNNDSLMNNQNNRIQFQNIIYLHEMYKKIFSSKKDEKYLFAEYFKLINIINLKMGYLLLINDDKLKKYFIMTFQYLIDNYNCTIEQKNYIKNITNLIKEKK